MPGKNMINYSNSYQIVHNDMETILVFKQALPVIDENSNISDKVEVRDVAQVVLASALAEQLLADLSAQVHGGSGKPVPAGSPS